uniref:Uncharacterized protein n=2 Tax=Hemiselmis andersenii TaxID=464988 RepID=A0A6U5CB22_HEMAN
MLLELAPQIANCGMRTPDQLDAFMKEVERRLGRLSDENMVLKAEQFAAVWPVRRLETMREAVARRREIEGLARSLDFTTPQWGVKSNVRDELQHVIDKFDAVRPVLDSLHRQQDDLAKKYKAERVPFDFDCIKEVHKSAVGLAKYSLRMIDKSHKTLAEQVGNEVAIQRLETLIETALRFSFRCHQFAGGFDAEATRLFASTNGLLDTLYGDAPKDGKPAAKEKKKKKYTPTKSSPQKTAGQ